jgi:hypothetical protein
MWNLFSEAAGVLKPKQVQNSKKKALAEYRAEEIFRSQCEDIKGLKA